jgi:short-subunit dehydrogenase
MTNTENIFSAHNKIILIIGSNSDMAKPLISYLKKKKAKLILVDKNAKHKKTDNFYKADLSDKNNIIKLTKKIKEQYKNLDAVINFIGISDSKNFEKNFQINVFSVHYIINSLIPVLKKNKCSIVNITSLNCRIGFFTNNPGYNSPQRVP